jgi:hypothetical protein
MWFGPLIGLVALALSAAPALAAQRYAAPVEAGARDCSSPADACAITTALAGASSGDEVIVEPGNYGTAGSPLTSEISSGAANLNVHGVDSVPGPPGARIFTSATIGVSLYGTGSTISDLEIIDSASGDGDALRFEGALAERLIVRAGKNEFYACDLQLASTIRDSLCQQEGTGYALETTGVVNGPNHLTARNVTAISKEGVGIYDESAASRPTTMNVLNTIARGGAFDIDAFEGSGQPATITTSHSNYTTTHTSNGATIGDDGTSQTVGDQTEGQLFSEPLGGGFQEALGAQTIGAGLIGAENGSLDFYGYPRVFDAGGACASTDIGAGQFVPSAGPAVTGATASAVLQLNATLSGAVNPLGGAGTAHFDYGPAAPGGGPPTSYSSTATQCLPVADTAQPVAASLAGLALGTTYYYRLVATNGNATTTPPFTATFTTEGLLCGCAEIVQFLRPELIGVKQSAGRWREAENGKEKSGKRKSHKRKLPLGTTFSFGLNESATVTFDFTEKVSGLEVGKRCVAQIKHNGQTKHNGHKGRCLRTVTAGALIFFAHVGPNKLNFQGVISRHKRLGPGSYTLLITASALGRHSKPGTLHFTIAND